MNSRKSRRCWFLALVAHTACTSGQTGDVGLGVSVGADPEPSADDRVTDAAAMPSVQDRPAQPVASQSDAGAPTSSVVSNPVVSNPVVSDPVVSTPPTNGESPSIVSTLPGDLLVDGGLTCVSAHSTVRLLVSDYEGPLYQLERADGTTRDVGAVDGYADADAHDELCANEGCVIKIVYDQSGMGNDLTEAPPGSAKSTPGRPVDASSLPVSIEGRSVYGMLFRPGMGYRKLIGNGTAQGDDPQTIYMVTSQHDLINGCCFDYGNAETSANNDGNGTAEAVYFGMGVIWGSGSGEGPWVMADLENGLYPGWENGQDRNISTNTSLQHDFVTAVLVGDTAEKNGGLGRFALYGGDATSGSLKTMYDGIRPEKPGYVPMQKQGSVILGVAGDNSDGDGGRFYEGVIANGTASVETLDALQAALVEARYGQQ